jgi:hypothetical protein
MGEREVKGKVRKIEKVPMCVKEKQRDKRKKERERCFWEIDRKEKERKR